MTLPRSPGHNLYCSQVLQSSSGGEENSLTNISTAESGFTELGVEHGTAKFPELSYWCWNCDVTDKKLGRKVSSRTGGRGK